MASWHVLVVAAAGCALTILVALLRDVGVLAGISVIVTLVASGITLVGWLRTRVATRRASWPTAAMVVLCAVAAPVAVATLPARLLGAAPTPAAAPSPTAPPSITPPATATPTPTPTADPALARYCELAFEFLDHAQRFSGKGWQGALKKRDFDPIVKTAKAALTVAPQEMRAPMTVLVSSYEAAREDWSDDEALKNIGLAVGTILSPSARAAADVVDAYEGEHCF